MGAVYLRGMTDVTAQVVADIVEAEIAAFDPAEKAAQQRSSEDACRATLADFQAARIPPVPVRATFSGGLTNTCWLVTRGEYRVAYMPKAGYFTLLASSDFGPLDIGVHGPAIDCFAAV